MRPPSALEAALQAAHKKGASLDTLFNQLCRVATGAGRRMHVAILASLRALPVPVAIDLWCARADAAHQARERSLQWPAPAQQDMNENQRRMEVINRPLARGVTSHPPPGRQFVNNKRTTRFPAYH